MKKTRERVFTGTNCIFGDNIELGAVPRGSREDEYFLFIGNGALIRSLTIIYAGSSIGSDFSTGHGALIREFVKVGNNVSIGSGSEIEQNTKIGDNVRIHSQCFVAEGTIIEDDVRIAPGVKIASDRHPLIPPEKKIRKGPHIKKGAYIGMGVVILPGITIGEKSFIGAGSVVTKDVPDAVVVAGNPARIVTTVEEYLLKIKA